LASLSEYRKQGIGGALVHAALLESQKWNCKQAMAILMPKGMAWGLFTKLGFEEVCAFPFYVFGISSEALEK
jgi:GNAT superfamily N-acetyltransferase